MWIVSADNVRIGAKIVLPKAIANHDRRGSLRDFIACIEQASGLRCDSKRGEISRRDDVPPDSLGMSVRTDPERYRSDVSRGRREQVLMVTKAPVCGIGDGLLKGNQLIGPCHTGHIAQDGSVQFAEESRTGTDSQAHRCHCDEGESWPSDQ